VLRGGRIQPAWAALPYLGSNPHEHHVHLSVVPDLISLDSAPWLLPGLFDTEEDVVAPADVWGFPVHDLYTPEPQDVMPAGVALEWAVSHSAHAMEAANAALATVQRIEKKQDSINVQLGQIQQVLSEVFGK
jgi:hypothetical protein